MSGAEEDRGVIRAAAELTSLCIPIRSGHEYAISGTVIALYKKDQQDISETMNHKGERVNLQSSPAGR